MTINPKQRVAQKATEFVKPDMVIGLGTGSTANYFVDALAAIKQTQQFNIDVVSSSVVTTLYARKLGFTPLAIEQVAKLDLYVDGADEVSPELTLLKGRGQDLVKEKLLATAAEQFIVLVDETKLVNTIGDNNPIPVEVRVDGVLMVLDKLNQYGQSCEIRLNSSGGAWFSAAGNVIIDLHEPNIETEALSLLLTEMPVVREHGIFTGLATKVLVGKVDKVEVLSR